MDDKELLFMAAKALGGIDPYLTYCKEWNCMAYKLSGSGGWSHEHYWDPLNDSGHCFEMAYKSGVDICFFDRYDTIEEFRRAIVEAVAKIGERMSHA